MDVDASRGLRAARGCRDAAVVCARERLPPLLLSFVCGAMDSMNSPCYTVAMDLGVCHLRHFSISFLSSLLSAESSHVKLDNR